MTSPWRSMREIPETNFYGMRFVDLLVRAEHSGALFRVPDSYLYESEWWSMSYHYPLSVAGWEPVAWMPVPEIPSEEELP